MSKHKEHHLPPEEDVKGAAVLDGPIVVNSKPPVSIPDDKLTTTLPVSGR